MNTVVDWLSPKAKEEICPKKGWSIGIFSTYKDENSLVENRGSLSNFEHDVSINDFFKAHIKEYTAEGIFLKDSLVLFHGDEKNPGNPRLLRYLQNAADQHGIGSFLYKPYDSSEFMEIKNLKASYVKYSYRNRVVKFSLPRSFFRRNPAEY